MIPLAQALATVLSHAPRMPEQRLAVGEAVGRFTATDLTASRDSPPFDRSTVDGYALRVSDCALANSSAPVVLRVAGQVAAGETWGQALTPGSTVKVMTGAELPALTEAVVMVEEAREDSAAIWLSRPVSPGENLSRQGEEFRAGDPLLAAGTKVTPAVMALLASLGHTHVAVRRTPRVALVTTGSEIVAPGERAGRGQVHDANAQGLVAALGALGIAPVSTGRCPDDLDALETRISQGIAQAEVVVTTGGVSMGDRDWVLEAAQRAGLKLVFSRVAVKPGKPFVFGTFRRPEGPDGLFFGLAGNPVSALVSFQMIVRPALERMMGAEGRPGLRLVARLKRALEKQAGRLELVRARLDFDGDALWVEPLSGRQSHMLLSLARANCLVHLPVDIEHLEAGSAVEISVLQWT